MDLSGIIFVVLAIAWAVYLVPKALKHHDEVARTRSIDRFSTAMRVLARREPVNRRNARLVVTPARSGERMIVPTRPTAGGATALARPVAGGAARREAARAAARRRRHVTLVLLVVDLVVVAAAGFGLVLWWTVAVPVALTAAYLVLCRRQVSRERHALRGASARLATAPQVPARAGATALSTGASTGATVMGSTSAVATATGSTALDVTSDQATEPVSAGPRRAIRVEAPYGTVQAPRESAAGSAAGPALEEFSPDEDTITIPMTELQTMGVPAETLDGGSLWDPLPVTLPTYVTKARASRTVRTIDLSAPGNWSSGRDEADSALVEQTTAAEAAGDEAGTERRAVGS